MWAFIDWGATEHQLCIIDDGGDELCQERLPHTVAGLAKLCDLLRGHADEGAVRVGLERGDGPLVDTLLDAQMVVYTINPKQIDRFRAFVQPSGAKDDCLDAYTGAQAMRTHLARFRQVKPPDSLTRRLRDEVLLRSEVVRETVRLKHRATEQLQRYYLQFVRLGSCASTWRIALWELVPTPEQAHRTTAQCVADLLRSHRVRRWTADDVLATLREPSLTTASGAAA